MKNWISKLGAFLLKPYLESFKKSVDYAETGGAPLLGINGVCIIAHGSSSSKAIKNAIKRAKEFVEKRVNKHIQEDIEINLEDQDLWMRKGIIWQNLKESINFGTDSADYIEKPKDETSNNIENPSELKESDDLAEPPKSPESVSLKPPDPKPEAAE